MISFIPKIYDGELFYSFLSRIYARGAHTNIGFRREWLQRVNEYPDHDFYNVLNAEAYQLLDHYLGMNNLIINHTLFRWFGRFIPNENRARAFEIAINNQLGVRNYLNIPLHYSEGRKLMVCHVYFWSWT